MSRPLKLYNTLSRSKEVFEPIDPENVRLYVCGPTVYDYAHIGNARPLIVFDVLFRLLRHRYGEDHVVYARNITDVDDKINARAARDFPDLPLNEAIREVTRATERQFHEDAAALGCLPPTEEPQATDHIAEMVAIIERLVARGLAYVAEDNVLFSPAAMDRYPGAPRYGSLARRSLDEMIAGARVDVAPYKRDPMDFVLWKPSKPTSRAGRARAASQPRPAGLAYRMLGHVDGHTAYAVRRRPGVRRPRRGTSSTSTAAASTSSFPIMKTRSPSPAAPSTRRAWPMCGCTTAFCRSKARRCRRASAISSPSTNC